MTCVVGVADVAFFGFFAEASEGEEDGDSLMADAERQAGVFEWSDFGAEVLVIADSNFFDSSYSLRNHMVTFPYSGHPSINSFHD